MTYRDRRLARAERLREWAEKRAASGRAGFQHAHNLVKDIPLGQPILVGHHSERRHRRTLERSDNAMRRACEDSDKAGEMASRADNIEMAVDGAIYRDDPDAIERLTDKLAELEGRRGRMKAENAAYRKGDEAYAKHCGITLEQAKARRVNIEAGYSWCRQPYPSYSLQNLGGTITKERKRLAELTAAKTSQGTAAVSPNASTPLERAGLIVTATMTTPAKSWKKPRAVWNVSGNLAYWRPILVDQLGGSWYHGIVSFWDDPTEQIEQAIRAAETLDILVQPAPRPDDPCEGRTIWNSDGIDGPCLICPPPK